MQLPPNALVVVADGAKLKLFRNTDTDQGIQLEYVPTQPESENSGAGARHQNSAANPANSQAAEDDFAAGVATLLNDYVTGNKTQDLVVIAAPRTLGELRKHYSTQLAAVLRQEIAKDLTGQPVSELEQAIRAA